MRRVQLVTPERFQWLEGYYNELSKQYEVVIKTIPEVGNWDCIIFLWTNQDTIKFINDNPKICKYIVYIRRYEFFGLIHSVQWDKVDEIVFVNNYLKNKFEEHFNKKTNLIYNGVNPSKWTYREHSAGVNIAMVGWINQKKNFPLAMQILKRLGNRYKLHIAGGFQDEATLMYISYFAEQNKLNNIIFYGRIKDMNSWLENKDYILSCAISEGCPNNVIEAMAKGIKPVVHNWPGATEQFDNNNIFTVPDEAAAMIEDTYYDSIHYRKTVEEKFGLSSYTQLRKLVNKCLGENNETKIPNA